MKRLHIDENATNRFSVWPYVSACGLALFVFIVQQMYEGRLFVDHDLHYSHSYFYNSSPPATTAQNPFDIGHDTITFWRNCQSTGRLPTTLLYLSSRLWPMNLWSYRFFNLPFWLLAMIAAYFLGRQLADRRAGWLCAALAATLPVFSASARTFLPHFHTTVFLLWTLVFLLKIFRDPKEFWPYPLLGISAGAAILSHPIGLLQTVPVFALLLLFLLWKKQYSSLIGWLTALALAASTNLTTWRILSSYIENKQPILGTQGILQNIAGKAVHTANWLHVVLTDCLLLPRFEILLTAITVLAVGGWLLRSRKISLDWLALSTLASLYMLLGTSQTACTRDAGLHFDLIGAFSLIGFLPVVGLYNLVEQHRHAELLRSLLIATVLIIGAWQQAEMLNDISADPGLTRENRTRISLPEDWMRQSVKHLRNMGAQGFTPFRLHGFIESPASPDFIEMDAVGIAYDLIAAGKLFSLNLVPPPKMRKIIDPSTIHHQTNWGKETGYSVKLFFYREERHEKEVATIIRRECPALPEENCRWFRIDNPMQNFDLPTANALVLISARPLPETSTQLQ